jgi:hypothetical protein
MGPTMAEDLVQPRTWRAASGEQPSGTDTPCVFAAHPQVTFWSTVVGKKVVMAMTGAVLVGFVIGHILGNLQIFMG